MLTEEKVRKLAARWVQAWNSHDLAEIMSHYAGDVVVMHSRWKAHRRRIAQWV
jgi:ketosteroid isomerase-like protein